MRRPHGPVDQPIEIGPHELHQAALRDVPGEGHRAGLVIDGQDGSDKACGLRASSTKAQGKQQRIRRQPRRQVAKVPLVQVQGWLAVDLEKDIADRASDQTLGPEDVPPTLRAMAKGDVVAIEPNCGNPTAQGLSVVEHPGLLKTVAVAGEPTRGDDVRGQNAVEAADQFTSVDVGSV